MASKHVLLRRMARIAVVLCSLWAFWQGLVAQDAPPWVKLAILDVNPVMVDEFLAVQQELSAQSKEAGTPWRSVSRTEEFGNPYRFLITTPIQNLASFDRRGRSTPEMVALNSRLQKCITNTQRYAVLSLPEMSNPLPEDEEAGLMVINFARVSPGREQEYLEVMKIDFLAHFDEEKSHHWTGSLAFGGESGFMHLFYVANFAELDRGSPVVRAVGADGAQQLAAKLAGIVTSSEMWIARHLPELSYRPAAEEAPK